MNKTTMFIRKFTFMAILGAACLSAMSCDYPCALFIAAFGYEMENSEMENNESFVYEVNDSGKITSENILPSDICYNTLVYPQTFNGAMLVAGNSDMSRYYSDAYFAKLSSDYSLEFEHQMDFDKGDVVLTADVYDDGSMLFGGSSRIEEGKVYYRMLLCKTDSNGNQLWSKAEKMNESTWYTSDAKAMHDGGALALAEEEVFIFSDMSENIIRYDKNGEIMWKKSFSIWGIFDPITNGKIIQTGQDSFIIFFGQYNMQSFLVELNGTDGTILDTNFSSPGLFSSTIDATGYDIDLGIAATFIDDQIYAHDIDLLSDGNLVFAGTNSSKNSIKTIIASMDGTVLAEDEFPYDDTKYNATNVMVCSLDNGFAITATFHENSSWGDFKYQTVASYSLQGKKIWSKDLSSKEKVKEMAITLDGDLRLLVEKNSEDLW
ncbi:MAG: hypothetical protein PF637_08835 [Spirochaetes bacterium]|jgi:hypothetical protein|nr:hypothetical protein [Spirochaetota bacterium]